MNSTNTKDQKRLNIYNKQNQIETYVNSDI